MTVLRKMWFILPIFRVQYLKKGTIRTTKRHATGTTNTSVASSLLAKNVLYDAGWSDDHSHKKEITFYDVPIFDVYFRDITN